jgi:hypothetical protein
MEHGDYWKYCCRTRVLGSRLTRSATRTDNADSCGRSDSDDGKISCDEG